MNTFQSRSNLDSVGWPWDRDASSHPTKTSSHPGPVLSHPMKKWSHPGPVLAWDRDGMGIGPKILVSRYQFSLLFLHKQLDFHPIPSRSHVKLVPSHPGPMPVPVPSHPINHSSIS